MAIETKDRMRQAVVAAGAVVAIVGAAWGSGAFGGTQMKDAAGGALAPEATLLAAATPAFQIWSLIYCGLLAFAVVQALPSRADSPRYRAVAWWMLASMLLNAAWIAVIQAGWLWPSVPVLLAIVAVLAVAAMRLARQRGGTWLDRAVTDVTVGLYVGWALVASAANLAAALNLHSAALAIAIIIVVLAAGTIIMLRLDSRPIGAAMMCAAAWGLVWIGVARLDDPRDPVVAAAAIAAATLAVLAAVWRLRRPSASALA